MDLLAIHNSSQCIAGRRAGIRAALLQSSPNIRQGDFERIGLEDVASLVAMYDREFFGGYLAQALRERTDAPLEFRLSTTMTRAGGKTSRYRRRGRWGGVSVRYEIAVASRMLLMTFRDVKRDVVVGGLACADRLDALQRILEHEILHLAEMLVWDESSCSGPRFKKLARDIFGHTEKWHFLVTAREHAAVAHGIRVGGAVEFDFDGRRRVGRVNRVHRRATVLVEDATGLPYTDGKNYLKFYVPLDRLKLVVSP
jgi:hypothetical protein